MRGRVGRKTAVGLRRAREEQDDANESEMLRQLGEFLQDRPEVAESVAMTMDPSKLSALCRVSTTFASICRSEYFWRQKTLRDLGLDEKPDDQMTWKQVYEAATTRENVATVFVNGSLVKLDISCYPKLGEFEIRFPNQEVDDPNFLLQIWFPTLAHGTLFLPTIDKTLGPLLIAKTTRPLAVLDDDDPEIALRGTILKGTMALLDGRTIVTRVGVNLGTAEPYMTLTIKQFYHPSFWRNLIARSKRLTNYRQQSNMSEQDFDDYVRSQDDNFQPGQVVPAWMVFGQDAALRAANLNVCIRKRQQ